jgi:hypothetical protein
MSTVEGGGNILNNGLVFYLDASNVRSYPTTGTSWTDLSRGDVNATLVNGLTYNSSNRGNIQFDGSNDYCSILATPQISGTQLTLSVWNYGLIAKQSTLIWLAFSSGVRCLNVHLPWSDSNVYFDAGDGSGFSYDRINKLATSSEYLGWHNWVFVKNSVSQMMYIYRDGNLWHSGSGKTRPIGLPTGTKTIGSENGTQFFHQAYLANLSLYNRELSLTEIQQNFNVTRSRFGV